MQCIVLGQRPRDVEDAWLSDVRDFAFMSCKYDVGAQSVFCGRLPLPKRRSDKIVMQIAESHVRTYGIVELRVRFVRQRLLPFRGVGEVERPGNWRTTLILWQTSSKYNMSHNR